MQGNLLSLQVPKDHLQRETANISKQELHCVKEDFQKLQGLLKSWKSALQNSSMK
jgi:hypothetical protein